MVLLLPGQRRLPAVCLKGPSAYPWGVRDPISTSTLVLQTGGEGGGERCVLAVAMVLLVLELTCPLTPREAQVGEAVGQKPEGDLSRATSESAGTPC